MFLKKSILEKAARRLHGRIDYQGLPVSIETGRSRSRQWYNPQDDSQGMSRMEYPYGYIQGTEGVDGDALDVFVGPDPAANQVYVVTTMKAPDFRKIDEQKCFIGTKSPEEAYRVFNQSYNDPRFFGYMDIWPMEAFKVAIQNKGKLLRGGSRFILPT